mmetsp:Transcript_12031/g.26212  ORF Transcript_12031/g.26212 Transcript_12031/m.26212 type:complete len:686 (+) Transcript_12031:238-2295(+)
MGREAGCLPVAISAPWLQKALEAGSPAQAVAVKSHLRALRTTEHRHGLVDLLLQLALGLQEHQDLAIVHFQHHASDLAGQFRLQPVDGREQLLAEHLFLHRPGHGSQLLGVDARAGGHTSVHRSLGHGGHALSRRHGGHHWAHHAHHVHHLRWHHATGGEAWSHHAHASLSHHALHLHGHPHGALLLHRVHHSAGEAAAAVAPTTELSVVHVAHAVLATFAHALAILAAHAATHATSHASHASHAAATTLHATHGGHVVSSCARHVALTQALLPSILLLGESDEQWLSLDHLQVHLGDGLRGLVRGAEAHKTKALAFALVVRHDSMGGDVAEWRKHGFEGVVGLVLIEILDVQIDSHSTSRLGGGLGLHLASSLGLAHGPSDEHELVGFVLILLLLSLLFLSAHVLAVEGFHGLGCALRGLEVHEAELSAELVLHDDMGSDGTELAEHGLELVLVEPLGQVLGIDVGEDGCRVPLVALQEALNFDCLLADLHAIDTLDGLLGGFLGLVVHEAIASRLTVDVAGHLAGEDVSKQAEGVVEGLVVDVAVQVLHEDVAHAALTEAGVALAPHDAAGPALDAGVVQSVQGALGVGDAVEVHVPIAKGLSRNTVAADSDGPHRAHGVEDLVKHRLCHVRHQVADVEGGKLRDSTGGSHLVEFFEEKVSSFSGFWGGICDFSTATTATVQE